MPGLVQPINPSRTVQTGQTCPAQAGALLGLALSSGRAGEGEDGGGGVRVTGLQEDGGKCRDVDTVWEVLRLHAEPAKLLVRLEERPRAMSITMPRMRWDRSCPITPATTSPTPHMSRDEQAVSALSGCCECDNQCQRGGRNVAERKRSKKGIRRARGRVGKGSTVREGVRTTLPSRPTVPSRKPPQYSCMPHSVPAEIGGGERY